MGAGAKVVLVHQAPHSEEALLLVRALEQENYHCAVFASGKEALEQCEPSLLGAAVLSLALTEPSAVELGRELKSLAGEQAFLPVIAVGQSQQIEAEVQDFAGACDDFVATSTSTTEFLVRVSALISRQQVQADLVDLNAELEREQERRRALAALIIHDLRNPLSAIVGNVQLLDEALVDSGDPMVGQCLGDLAELSERTLSMVAGLLDVEEFEGGVLQARPEQVDVDSFVSRLPTFYKTATEARKLTLSVNCPAGLRANFDRQLIGRILENLLDNAVRYAPRNGRVVLTVSAQASDLLVQVGNNGPAIPELERDRMFERYYRIEARRKGARANRGLGLYFCRLAAVAHQGTIEVVETSALPACFVLRLPNAVEGSDDGASDVSVRDGSANNASVNNASVNNASVNNVSINNASINNASVNNVSINDEASELLATISTTPSG